jgi:C4-dicarboxylate transporter, DctQ subunit
MRKVLIAINNNLEEVICPILLSSIVLLMGFQVFGRYIFGYVSPAFEEISRWSFVWFIYFGASLSAKNGGHYRVSVYKLVLKGQADTVVTMLGNFLWFGFNVFMVLYGFKFVITVFKYQFLSSALMFPLKYIYPIIPLGFFLIAVRMALLSLKELLDAKRTGNHGH